MKIIKLLLVFGLAFLQTSAQKLPNKQKLPLSIPSNFKIDGRATEWDNSFQAYNTATSLFYTVANNAEYIYLIAHAKDPAVIKRITDYGFTFEVYKNDNPQNKDLISVTLPLAASKYFSLNLIKPTKSDTVLEKGVVKANNSALFQHHKFIVVKGVAGLDSISVYNDEAGIRFAEAFDSNNDYTIELQLPVKFIKILPGDSAKFFYHMAINGMPNSGPSRGLITLSANGTTTFTAAKDITPEQQAAIDELEDRIAKKYAPTDFKAEYTLAK